MSYFRSVYILDKNGNPFGVDQDLEGSESRLSVHDVDVEQLLIDILSELRIMNLHLSSLTDEKINIGEIENDY